MANIFERLLGLYKIQNTSGKTPLEDFVTELLAGVLQSDQQLLDKFVNEVLRIEGTGFKIESQSLYLLPADRNCIIDLVFENDMAVCFLENKVASGEGERQLERYAAVLDGLGREKSKDVYLRYCTKLYDPKEVAACDFSQFRWQTVYEFFRQQEETPMIGAFSELLRSEEMAGIEDFKPEDLVIMKGFYEVMSKMDEVLDLAKPAFIQNFGEPYQRDYARLKQLPQYNRYTLWTSTYKEKDIEIMMGFEMESTLDHRLPNLFIQVWQCQDKTLTAKLQQQSVAASDKFDHYEIDGDDVHAWFEMPLPAFLAAHNQKEQMVSWFIEKMTETKKLVDGLLA